jgi:excinuclease ABC subunit A
LPEEKLNVILFGTGGEEVEMDLRGGNNRQTVMRTSFEGVIPNLMRRFRETQSEYIRSKIQEYMSDKPCPKCNGERLRPESLAVTVDGLNIMEVTGWPVERTLPWVEKLMGGDSPLNERDKAITERVLKEIRDLIS